MRYKIIHDGELDIIIPKKQYEVSACCDCGLVHDINYEIKGKKLIIKTYRNRRSTGQMRRWMKKNKKGMYWEAK